MRLLINILTLTLISFTKFNTTAIAEEKNELNNTLDQQVEGDEQFQILLENVSPTQFQEINENYPDMSFKAF
jgi:hypothetical protein